MFHREQSGNNLLVHWEVTRPETSVLRGDIRALACASAMHIPREERELTWITISPMADGEAFGV